MSNIINLNEKRNKYEIKKEVVFNFILNYFKELKETGVDIPYFLKAREWYKQNVKDLKDLNYWYKKIINRNI